MSNATLVKRISEAVSAFEANTLSFTLLREVIEATSKAIESLPYSMVIELREIESRLAVEQTYRDEECLDRGTEAIARLKRWLDSVPQ